MNSFVIIAFLWLCRFYDFLLFLLLFAMALLPPLLKQNGGISSTASNCTRLDDFLTVSVDVNKYIENKINK